MINLLNFELDHLDNFIPKDNVDFDVYSAMEKNLVNPNRMVLSLMGDNGLVCIAGMNILREGVGELWLIPGEYVDDNKFEFYKTVKALIYGYVFSELKFHRLEMAIKADWRKGLKWAASLGFIAEGLAHKWNHKGEDHVLFARVVQ